MKLGLSLLHTTASPSTSVRRNKKSQNYIISLPHFRSLKGSNYTFPRKQGLPMQCIELEQWKDLSIALKNAAEPASEGAGRRCLPQRKSSLKKAHTMTIPSSLLSAAD